jgi:hypothetical protein
MMILTIILLLPEQGKKLVGQNMFRIKRKNKIQYKQPKTDRDQERIWAKD